ncbi:outer membrane protein [Candidatus Berkiella aquae]|uniref:Porin family protein n=1 Tax=Candidatus Berkiella aquae TaxID=295108 RepID=A0A0Q9YIF2_9GAMM|nr:outer membrane beta-barrel protein [Candidatus Berkiella aquae]MCS5712254.1 porin family protein [Candidatus Berkiella aquae]
MKTNKISLVLLSTLSLCAIDAIANPYVSGQFGVYGTRDSNNVYDNLFHSHKARATGRIGAGYLWDVNPCTELGLEGGVQGYQKLRESYNNVEASLRRYSIDVLGVVDYYPTVHGFDLFAKAGAAYIREKATIHLDHFDASARKGAVVPKAVIGAGYDIINNVNVNLALSHEFKRSNAYFFPAATSAMIGAKYTFF